MDDGKVVGLINEYEESFKSMCDKVRDGVDKSDIVPTSFVSSVIVSMKESTHIMYIDACHCSDHSCILLAIFMDGNYRLQLIVS